MKILDVLHESAILVDLKSIDKVGVLHELVVPAACIAGVNDIDIFNTLMDRERLGSTGIGEGIGIPHGKLNGFKELILSFGLSKQGVDFESVDGKPVHVFFLLIAPENFTSLHLKFLACISRLLKNKLFKEILVKMRTTQEIIDLIKENDDGL